MPQIQTQIEIDAAPEIVWRVLTDFAGYPDWNPFVTSIEGSPAVGEQLTVRLEPPGARAVTVRPTIRRFDANQEFRWLGKIGLSLIFEGEQHFRLEPNGNGTTFHHGEQFRGLLAVPMLWFLRKSTEGGFDSMNSALKARAEGMGDA